MDEKINDRSGWWSIDSLLPEIKKTIPKDLAGIQFNPSSLGTRWSQDQWEHIKDSYPERIQGGIQGYSYPEETKELFFAWLPTYWDSIRKKRSSKLAELALELPPNVTRENCVFTGKRICFTGFKAAETELLRHLAEQLKCEIKNDVSSNMDYLVCGAKPGEAKIDKAIALMKCIVPLDAFIRNIM